MVSNEPEWSQFANLAGYERTPAMHEYLFLVKVISLEPMVTTMEAIKESIMESQGLTPQDITVEPIDANEILKPL